MRNLHVVADRKEELPVPVELGDVVQFAVDSDGGMLFVAGTGLGVAAYRTADCEVRAAARADETTHVCGSQRTALSSLHRGGSSAASCRHCRLRTQTRTPAPAPTSGPSSRSLPPRSCCGLST